MRRLHSIFAKNAMQMTEDCSAFFARLENGRLAVGNDGRSDEPLLLFLSLNSDLFRTRKGAITDRLIGKFATLVIAACDDVFGSAYCRFIPVNKCKNVNIFVVSYVLV